VGEGFVLLPLVWLSTWKIQRSHCLSRSSEKNFTGWRVRSVCSGSCRWPEIWLLSVSCEIQRNL